MYERLYGWMDRWMDGRMVVSTKRVELGSTFRTYVSDHVSHYVSNYVSTVCFVNPFQDQVPQRQTHGCKAADGVLSSPIRNPASL